MIVNHTEQGWQIITQRSHGLLAGEICAQWKKVDRPGRWLETLIAVAEHDDVYNEFENDDLLNQSGGPVNFKQTSFRKDYCERLIQRAETKSAYIALLISRHIQFVHGSDPAGKKYCADLQNREKDWLKTCGLPKSAVKSAYELLQFCDAFSFVAVPGTGAA